MNAYRRTRSRYPLCIPPAALMLLCILAAGDMARAHGGEDHGEAAAAATPTPAAEGSALSTHGSTSLFELLVKYPAVETGEDTRLRLFLADFATNKPLEGARFTLAFKPSGVELVGAPTMISPGVYDLVARFPADTIYSLVATVAAGTRTDFIEVRNIYAGEAAVRFLADHGGDATETGEPTGEGLPLWQTGLIALGGLALVTTAVAILRRRSGGGTRMAPSSAIPRDPVRGANVVASSIEAPEATPESPDTRQSGADQIHTKSKEI